MTLAKPLLYQRLDGLRAVLEGDAAKDMDLLIGRVSRRRRALKEPGVGSGMIVCYDLRAGH